jgi:hypothetical protein
MCYLFEVSRANDKNILMNFPLQTYVAPRSAQNRLATIRLPNAGPTTGLKSAKSGLYVRRLLADFRPAVGPAFGSRMVANQIRADRDSSVKMYILKKRGEFRCHSSKFNSKFI